MNTQISVSDVEGIGFTFLRDLSVNFTDSNGNKSVITSQVYSLNLLSTDSHDIRITGKIENGKNTFNYFSLETKIKSVKSSDGIETLSVRTSAVNGKEVDFALTSIILRQIKDINDLYNFIKHI